MRTDLAEADPRGNALVAKPMDVGPEGLSMVIRSHDRRGGDQTPVPHGGLSVMLPNSREKTVWYAHGCTTSSTRLASSPSNDVLGCHPGSNPGMGARLVKSLVKGEGIPPTVGPWTGTLAKGGRFES